MSNDDFFKLLEEKLSKSHEKELVTLILGVVQERMGDCLDIRELVTQFPTQDIVFKWVVDEIDEQAKSGIKRFRNFAIWALISAILPAAIEVGVSTALEVSII